MRGFKRTAIVALAGLALVCAAADQAWAAATSTVPEIEASMVPAAIGLVSVGVLMLRARGRSK